MNERELNKYLAAFELLNAINIFKGIKEEISIEQLSDYVNILNQHILNSLNFDEVFNMINLQNIIRNDKLYNQCRFHVKEIKCTKGSQFIGIEKETNNCQFGNIKYYEKLDDVSIDVYDDFIELEYKAKGRSYTKNLDTRKRYTLEEKLKMALNTWKSS